MKKIIKISLLLFLIFPSIIYAGTMKDYLALVNATDKLSNSTDPGERQAAVFGTNVIQAADQSIAETILLMNAAAAQQGHPVFCPPKDFTLSGEKIRDFVFKGFSLNTLPEKDKLVMPEATFAINALIQMYPCAKSPS